MSLRAIYFFAVLSVFVLFSGNAKAEFVQNGEDSVDYLVLEVGRFETQHRGIAHTAEIGTQIGIGYKAHEIGYGFAPIVGLRTNNIGSYYGFAGMSWNAYVLDNVVFSPSFSVGYYEEGSGADLGGPLEFRSALELDYEFENRMRAGIHWDHISNANIYDVNPGYESLMATYAIPFSTIQNLAK